MLRSFGKLWSDDCGAVLTSELLFLYSMLVVGTVSGLVAMRQATINEMAETANSLMALSQSYSFSGMQIGGVASTAGSSTTDQPGTITPHSASASSAPMNVIQAPCE